MRAFSLLEIIIVIFILSALFASIYYFQTSFYDTFLLEGEKELLLNVLRKARIEAAENLYQSPRGVYLTSTAYIIFSGQSFTNRNTSYDINFPHLNISIASPFSEIVFSQLIATSSASGTIILSKRNKSFKILINNEGYIDW